MILSKFLFTKTIERKMERLLPYKLVALDLDGTTLNSHHQVSELTAKVLKRLEDMGVIICVATGRSSVGIYDVIKAIDLKGDSVPIVCFNGSIGLKYDVSNQKVEPIFSNPVCEKDARQLIDYCESKGLLCQYYNENSGEVQAVPMNEEHEDLMKRYAAIAGKPQVVLDSYEAAFDKSLPAKLLVLTNDPDKLIHNVAHELPSCELNVIKGSPFPFFVEFLAPSVSKGDGVRRIVESLQLSLSDVIAFGDGENDKEMLESVGCGVAVGNARPLAKSSAKVVLQVSFFFALFFFLSSSLSVIFMLLLKYFNSIEYLFFFKM